MTLLLLLLPAAVLAACMTRRGRGFLAGHPLDGSLRTNATFLRAPTRTLHPTADRSAWHWRPGWHRGAARMAAVTFTVGLLYGLLSAPAVTVSCVAACVAAVAGYVAWRLARGIRRWYRACAWDPDHKWRSVTEAVTLPWRHWWHYRMPLHTALTATLRVPPVKVRVALDRSTATIRLPAEFTGADLARESVTRTVAAKLALEDADPAWKLHTARPRVTFRTTTPPPGRLTWNDVAADIEAASPHELICGAGRKDTIVRASLELDSPHFGVAAGTGGGKSSLAALWLVQVLRRGDIALILDAKRFSHPWTFKDMDAEYAQLPNVAYCRTVADLHNAMCWLGIELDRRNGIAEATISAQGDVRGNVGPRLWVLAEEMNLAHGALKQYWADIRGPQDLKRSPAFGGLGAVSYAGRAVKMHLIVVGQMLRADILGGGDVRENIGVRCLTRYTANSWKMQAGDLPMPPPSRVPGRWQQIASGEVTEVQVPYVAMEQARDLAAAGTVTPCPAGMPGAAIDMSVRPLQASYAAPEQQFVVRQEQIEPAGLTIREAVEDGIFGPLSVEAARRRIQRADLEPAGRCSDGSHTYTRADLFKAAKDRRAKGTPV